MADQVPFGEIELASNPEPRCPCVLLIDVSGSMNGTPINALNLGLQSYKTELTTDSLASQRVEVSIVTFGGTVETVSPFSTVHSFTPPNLVAGGQTPMGEAIVRAIDMIAERKQQYKQNGLHYFRPWIFLITDGEPTDSWKTAAELVKKGEASKAFAFFAVGVGEANFDILKQIASRDPLRLEGLRFKDLFVWLSQSQRTVSHSKPGQEDQVAFTNPTAPGGWASL